MFACIVEADKKLFVLTDKDGHILANEQKQLMLDYWTKSWERGLARGGTWNSAACLSFIEFRPSVVEFTDIPDLQERIVGKRDEYHMHRIKGNAGWFDGVQALGTGAQAAWDGGTQPTFFREKEMSKLDPWA